MRSVFRVLARVLVLFVLAAALVGFWKREEITRLLAVNSLFSEEKITHNFTHMDALFLTQPMSRGAGPVSPLPEGPEMTLPNGVEAWAEERHLTSMLVMRGGHIRYERYYSGTADDHRISWSVAKSFLSALTGILLAEGAITSLDDPVTNYAPTLKGTAYDGASVRNVLQMASGVEFDEDYLKFSSDINKMGRTLALGSSMDGFAASLDKRISPPGEAMRYVSIDTHILGMVIRGATGRTVPELMQEKIISKLGFQADPYYVTDGYGVAFVLGGLNLTTRDYARFGQMILQDGTWQGQQVVPADWIAQSTRPSSPTPEGKMHYGLHWWMAKNPRPGEFLARGIYGQYIYFDTSRDVMIVVTAADRKFRDDGVTDQSMTMLRNIASAATDR